MASNAERERAIAARMGEQMFSLLGRPRGAAALASASIAALVASMSPAYAQEREQAFNVPAQSLSSALIEFSRQSDVRVIADPALVNGRHSPGVAGTFTAEQALARLLAGTGLRPHRSGDGGLSVVADSASPTRLGAADRAAPSAPQEEEAIVVVGTRIRGAETASPIYSFNREDFAQSGAGSVQEVLRTLPQNFTGGPSEVAGALSSVRSSNEYNLGLGAGVNLRGLGPESTLVLLNGRRPALAGVGNFVDVSTIPLSAVERIEVMPDGASAVYGSDAVGGVVNFILREDFEGAETRVRHAFVTDGGLRQWSASQLLGARWQSGSVLLNMDYGQSDPLLTSDRPYAIGLQTGINHLTPEEERLGVLINGRQSLTSSLELGALIYANARDTVSTNWVPTQARQQDKDTNSSQFGGTFTVGWDLGENWRFTLARTHTLAETHRRNEYHATMALPAQRTEVIAEHEGAATELEVEGALFRLPGGAVRLAGGLERRTEEFTMTRIGLTDPFATFERDVDAAYAEVFAPLVGAGNALPFVHRLNLIAAARYEDYSDVGQADTYKTGLVWGPFEGLDLRATYSTSFRAPFLYQFHDGNAAGVMYGAPFFPIPVIIVVNQPDPDLGPETAESWTAGFDLSPSRFGFRLSATYFEIAYENRIRAAVPDFNILTNPAVAALVSIPPDPAIVDAAVNAPGGFFNLSGVPVADAGASFDSRTRNQGYNELRGLDVLLEKHFDTGLGRFTLGANANYLFAYETALTEGAPTFDVSDTVFNPVDLRVRGHLHWDNGPWSASAFVNYVDGYTDDRITGAPVDVSSWTTFDVSGAYRFQSGALDGLTIRLNAINLTDEAPPQLGGNNTPFGNAGFDTENANPLGRMLSIEITQRW